MHGEYAIRLQVTQVQRESFARQKVHGNGVAGKCVDCQHIKLLRRFLLQREARVAEHHVNSRRRIAQVTEIRFRNLDDLRIDFVEASSRWSCRTPPASPPPSQSRRRVLRWG